MITMGPERPDIEAMETLRREMKAIEYAVATDLQFRDYIEQDEG